MKRTIHDGHVVAQSVRKSSSQDCTTRYCLHYRMLQKYPCVFLRIHLQAPQGTSEERTWGRPRGSWRSRKSSPATEKRPGAPRHPITTLRNTLVEKMPLSSRTFNRFSIRTYRIQTYSIACRIPHQILRM